MRTQEALSGIPALPIPRRHLQLGLCEERCPLGGGHRLLSERAQGELTPNREPVLTLHLGGFWLPSQSLHSGRGRPPLTEPPEAW